MKWILPLTAFALLGAALYARATELHKEASPARFRAADNAFRERVNEEAARCALLSYRAIYAEKPDDVQAAWRVGMAAHFIGMRLAKEDEEKMKYFGEGRDAARAGLKLDPNCAPCHFWAAINMALYGQAAGIFKMLFTLTEIKQHLKASSELDPGYVYGGANRVLGRMEEKIPGIFGGSNERAREYYEKAIESAPDEPLNHLFLARLLKEELDEPDAAREVASRGVSLPVPSEDRVESREGWFEMKEFRDKLFEPLAASNGDK